MSTVKNCPNRAQCIIDLMARRRLDSRNAAWDPLLSAGQDLCDEHNKEDARRSFEQVLKLADDLMAVNNKDAKRIQATGLTCLGTLSLCDKDAKSAIDRFLQGESIFEQDGDKYGQAVALFALAQAHWMREEWTKAFRYFEHSKRVLDHIASDSATLYLRQMVEEKYSEAIAEWEKASMDRQAESNIDEIAGGGGGLSSSGGTAGSGGGSSSGGGTVGGGGGASSGGGIAGGSGGSSTSGGSVGGGGGSSSGGGTTGGGGAVPLREPHGNYAIAVVGHREETKRSFPRPSLATLMLLAVGLCLLGLPITLRLVEDTTARIIVIVLFFLAILGFLVVFAMLKFQVNIPSGSVGVLLGKGKPRLVEGAVWQLPLGEALYDVIPLGQRDYRCEIKFSERRGAHPIMSQDIRIQYNVTKDQLDRSLKQLPGLPMRSQCQHPLIDFWESEMADHIQRYFEDLPHDGLGKTLDDPIKHEQAILDMLKKSSDKHSWGIDLTDREEGVHLGYHRSEI